MISERLRRAGLGALLLLCGCAGSGPEPAPRDAPPDAQATFTVPDSALHQPLTLVAYGDMRFTDPANVTATNPQARQALIGRIAAERPDAVFLGGDVPYIGGQVQDYAVFHQESAPWREAGLRVYPALGNHEFRDCAEADCLEHWWAEFPPLRGRRWYSVQLGAQVYAIALDSDASLLPGSAQQQWLAAQLAALPASVRFVLLWLHHPPLADAQDAAHDAGDNARPNELALRDQLDLAAAHSPARFLVVAAHIHNYERFQRGAVSYLVSGGGGARPSPVQRGADDLFQSAGFPNYHYVRLVLDGGRLRGTMVRLDDPAAPHWSEADRFELDAAP
jgi:hypothetical protein